MSRRRLLPLCLVALVFAACGSEDEATPERAGASRPTPEVREALKDPRSSVSVAREFFRFTQAGALPGALAQYDPRVVRVTGPGIFAGMLAAQEPQLTDVRFNPLRTETVGGGVLVTAELIPRAGAKTTNSFYLRRRDGRWKIHYDTLTARGIQFYAQTRVQRGINPGAEAPSARAAKAGDDAVSIYRSVGLGLDRVARTRAAAARRRGVAGEPGAGRAGADDVVEDDPRAEEQPGSG